MEQRIEQLFKRLKFLGYCRFEMNSILQEAIGSNNRKNITPAEAINVNVLEKYEKLGSDYLLSYSK